MRSKSVFSISSAVVFLLLAILLLASCDKEKGQENNTESKVEYMQITQEEAKNIMDTQSGYIILDVRTDEEYAAGHIPDAILIPDYEIGKRAESELKDKSQLILVYCRSGRRSKNAAAELVSLGYTNVKEFGGINDWKYEIVK